MSKILRYDGDVKAFGSNAVGTERTLFGSDTQADDLTSQLTADFLRGWGIVSANEFPTLEDFNAMGYTLSQFIAYLHQMGVPEWNGAQEYHIGSATIFGGKLYLCKTDNHTSITDPATDTVNWSVGLDQSSIVNNLTSTDTTKALSAAQGKVLQDTTVKLTGDQTVAGVKTFSSQPLVTATQGTGANDVLKYGTINTANSAPVKTALNAGGDAPIYACRAWVNFNGTTSPATIRASGNVSSVTRNGAGDYSVNFATAMPDANYAYTLGAKHTAGNLLLNLTQHDTFNPTNTALRLLNRNQAGNNLDSDFLNVAVFS
jgi:hypothetical protein